MLESHRATRDARLGSERADLLVELITQRGPERGFYGAKLAGGEGGGVTLLLEESAGSLLDEVVQEYRQKTSETLNVLIGSSSGAAEAAPRRIPVAELASSH